MNLSKREFIEALRKNAGIYARTAVYITNVLKIPYTRQGVRVRAMALPQEVIADILDEVDDNVESGLQDMMRSKNERNKLETLKYLSERREKRKALAAGQAGILLPGGEIRIVVIDKREDAHT